MIAQEYSPKIQSRLICALAVLHNFIRVYDPSNTFEDTEIEMESSAGVNRESAQVERRTATLADWVVGNEECNWASERRESIALAMWADYQLRHRARGARIT